MEENIRLKYLNNSEEIEYQDPKTGDTRRTSVQALARRTWSGKSFSYFLIKLCEWLQVSTFLETGTALGITYSMVAHAQGMKNIYSIEGSASLAEKARQLNFKPNEVNSSIYHGEVRSIFRQVLEETNPDIVFLDADHRSETISFYLNELKQHKSPLKAIVIHDIYWSEDMREAWKKVVDDPAIPLTVDCFHAGIVFPSRAMEKQHFILKY